MKLKNSSFSRIGSFSLFDVVLLSLTFLLRSKSKIRIYMQFSRCSADTIFCWPAFCRSTEFNIFWMLNSIYQQKYYFLKNRQPPTFPYRRQHSIIGRLRLNHRVRDGNGCFPQAYRHRKSLKRNRTVCPGLFHWAISFKCSISRLTTEQYNQPLLLS